MTNEQIADELGRIQRGINAAADIGQTAIREAISIIEEMQRDCQRRLFEAQEMQKAPLTGQDKADWQDDYRREMRKQERV